LQIAGTPSREADGDLEAEEDSGVRIEFDRASEDTLDLTSTGLNTPLDGSTPLSETTPQVTPTHENGQNGAGNGEKLVGAITPHPLAAFGAPSVSPPIWERVDPPDSAQQDKFSSARTRVGRLHEFGKAPPRIPRSSYYTGPPGPDSAFGTPPIGQIGVHHPREVVRVERDYSGGEIVQFSGTWPLELEGRITPTQFLETINAINERLLAAHSLRGAALENALAFFTLQLSRAVWRGKYDTEMQKLKELIDDYNVKLYNPEGLHIRWPRKVAFLFLEIEYY